MWDGFRLGAAVGGSSWISISACHYLDIGRLRVDFQCCFDIDHVGFVITGVALVIWDRLSVRAFLHVGAGRRC